MKLRTASRFAVFCLLQGTLHAAWQDEIGFTRLQSLAGGEIPTAPSQGISHVEASVSQNSAIYAPDTSLSTFSGKSFSFVSGASTPSFHATQAGRNFYGSNSLIPGATDVDLYLADDWLYTDFLNTDDPVEPEMENRAVQSHSWIYSGFTEATSTQVGRRLDFAINRDGFSCVVGLDNNTTIPPPALLSHSYHVISVGRDDGQHSFGTTTLDGLGRTKPDIVGPSAYPENATSWTTPMVAGAAGLLHAALSEAPYSLAGADLPRTIKALLLATATKNTVPGWDNSLTNPLDSVYGAGELNVWHAYNTLRAGRVAASNITQYGSRAWAAETLNAGALKTYYFNIPAGAPSTPFCATLTWHRVIKDGIMGPDWGDPTSYLANLKLKLHHASGLTTGALIIESNSSVDNVELVYQAALPPGDYAIVAENTEAPDPPDTDTPYALAWHSLPAATVTATSPIAREINGDQGQFTITRSGDTALPLLVPLTIGGSAVPGSHYTALPASVTIPAGQSSATLQVIPVSDNLAQGTRTVSVAIAADFALVRDVAQTAIASIEDKPFDHWRFTNFTTPELANPVISSETADPDDDNLANLIEYALGLPPKVPGISTVQMIDISGYLAIAAGQNPAATDITWSAEVSGTLDAWTPATIIEDNDPPATFEARDTVLKSAADKRFIRLKISRP